MKQSSQTSNLFDETPKFPIFAKSSCGSREPQILPMEKKSRVEKNSRVGHLEPQIAGRVSREGAPRRGGGAGAGHPVRLSPFLPLPLLPKLSAELRCCNSVPVVLFASPKPRAWFIFLSLTRISLPALRDWVYAL